MLGPSCLNIGNCLTYEKKQKDHEVVIGLDHNLDLLKSHLNHPTNDFIELNLDRDLIPCITKLTRITNKSATLIDNILNK